MFWNQEEENQAQYQAGVIDLGIVEAESSGQVFPVDQRNQIGHLLEV